MVRETTASHRTKSKHRKGLWSPDEDQRLRNYILNYGHGCWSSLPSKAGLERNGKSCRLRWINYLRPGLKRGMFSQQEQQTILSLHHMLGNKWSQIAQHLPGRTDNEVKNLWHSYLKKKLDKQQQKQPSYSSTNSTTSDSADSSTTNPSIHSPKPNNNNSQLPKLFFAEWLTVGSSDNCGSEFGPSTNNLNGQPNFEFGMTLGSELLQNNGILMDSHVKFEDHHTSNGFANYASAGDVCVEHLLHFGNGFMNI
ncbi:hypothetical protein IC582_006833 [Cucumis melo]|uniref:Transcription factor LAF1 n=2 Tax=Cucumis melo TaxID=3656 RepID=A0A1S3CRA7_CUCME|nr:transcription factor LAF1 [Cucumis melo]KAA0038489.1 transcription factor LAF1 [Cucumis melo var. makuwa]TYK03338.1 transcription factor LAF1 [Cucumis melo var. makuwa]